MVYVLAVMGDTAIEFTVLACTVSVTAALVTPPSAAVIALVPAATPVASPVELTVATLGTEEDQAAVVLTFPVDPSL